MHIGSASHDALPCACEQLRRHLACAGSHMHVLEGSPLHEAWSLWRVPHTATQLPPEPPPPTRHVHAVGNKPHAVWSVNSLQLTSHSPSTGSKAQEGSALQDAADRYRFVHVGRHCDDVDEDDQMQAALATHCEPFAAAEHVVVQSWFFTSHVHASPVVQSEATPVLRNGQASEQFAPTRSQTQSGCALHVASIVRVEHTRAHTAPTGFHTHTVLPAHAAAVEPRNVQSVMHLSVPESPVT